MRYLPLLLLLLNISCNSSKKAQKIEQPEITIVNESAPAPKLLIYKTKKDYANLVPISLSDDKKIIVSYPHPGDLMIDGKLVSPVKLREGYYLDVKGIDKNVAFLKITYTDYSKLPSPPTIEQLKELIEDNDPLVELWDCGIKMNEPGEIEKINQWIASDKIAEFAQRIK